MWTQHKITEMVPHFQASSRRLQCVEGRVQLSALCSVGFGRNLGIDLLSVEAGSDLDSSSSI